MRTMVSHFAEDMERRLSTNESLVRAFDPKVNPSPEHRRDAYDPVFEDVLHEMIDSNFDLYKKIVEDPRFGHLFKEFVFERVERNLRSGRR